MSKRTNKKTKNVKEPITTVEPFENRTDDIDSAWEIDNRDESSNDSADIAAMDLAEKAARQDTTDAIRRGGQRRLIQPETDDIVQSNGVSNDNQRAATTDGKRSGQEVHFIARPLETKRSSTEGLTINLCDGTQCSYPGPPMAIPKCYCGIGMRVGRCGQGENKGRLFYTCARNDKGSRCSGFTWVQNPLMKSWLLNYPKDAAYNPYAQLHAEDTPKQARTIRANYY